MAKWKSKFCRCKPFTCFITFLFPCLVSAFAGFRLELPKLAFLSVVIFGFTRSFNVISSILWLFKGTQNIFDLGKHATTAHEQLGSAYYVMLLLAVCFSLAFGIIVVRMRLEMRRQRAIRGTRSNDCFLGICCTYCTLCQMFEQIEYDHNYDRLENRDDEELQVARKIESGSGYSALGDPSRQNSNISESYLVDT